MAASAPSWFTMHQPGMLVAVHYHVPLWDITVMYVHGFAQLAACPVAQQCSATRALFASH